MDFRLNYDIDRSDEYQKLKNYIDENDQSHFIDTSVIIAAINKDFCEINMERQLLMRTLSETIFSNIAHLRVETQSTFISVVNDNPIKIKCSSYGALGLTEMPTAKELKHLSEISKCFYITECTTETTIWDALLYY